MYRLVGNLAKSAAAQLQSVAAWLDPPAEGIDLATAPPSDHPPLAESTDPVASLPACLLAYPKPLPVPTSGELLVQQALESLGLRFYREVSINDKRIRNKRFDFFFESDGRHFLVEYDGKQHFVYTPYLHRVESAFVEGQAIDKLKQNIALSHGFSVIRIDYSANNVDLVRGVIVKALAFKRPRVTYSHPELYTYLSSE